MSHLPHIASQASLTFFQNRFPYRSKHTYGHSEWLALEEKYTKWYYITIALVVLYLCIFPFSSIWLLFQAYDYIFSRSVDVGETFFPLFEAIFIIPGLLLALFLMGPFIEFVQKALLGGRFDEFEDYYSAKQQYDNHASLVWLRKVLAIPLFISVLFVIPSHIIVKKDSFSVKMFYQLFPHKYQFNDIKKVTYYPYSINKKGEEKPDPHYKLFFNDNSYLDIDYHISVVSSKHQLVELLKKIPDTVRVDTE